MPDERSVSNRVLYFEKLSSSITINIESAMPTLFALIEKRRQVAIRLYNDEGDEATIELFEYLNRQIMKLLSI